MIRAAVARGSACFVRTVARDMEQPLRITPSVWGPPMWRTMHIVAMSYPDDPDDETRKGFSDFYRSLMTTIPCPACRREYREIMIAHPVEEALSCGDDLFKWTVLVHNNVSERLGKLPMTSEHVRNSYVYQEGFSAYDPQVDERIHGGLLIYGTILLLAAASVAMAGRLFRAW